MSTLHTPHAGTVGHAHVADLDACLAFINTLELDGTEGVPDDHIPTVDDAVTWVAGRALAHEAALRAEARRDPDAFLARVRDNRAAFREIWDATVEERSPDGRAIAQVNAVLPLVPSPEIRATRGGIVVGHRDDGGDPLGEAIARLASALVEAIAEGDTSRFRVCANDACRWVFEDTSRGGRRRWCDMQSCGNRAKVRRYRSRHKAGEGDEAGQADEAPAG